MKCRPYGDRAVLLDCASLDEARSWYAALSDHVEAVLGAQTVLLRGVPAELNSLVARTTPVQLGSMPLGPLVEVPVVYDGEDLDAVVHLTGLTRNAVIEAHTRSDWTAAFGGFAPGFSYLIGGDPRLEVPRRNSPRTSVPAGAVGLAGQFSGIYPRSSPGGWQLIGRTDVPMWDLDRTPPALLVPGTRVRFVAVAS